MGGALVPVLLAVAAPLAAATPGAHAVSPLVVVPQPRDAPHPDATVVIGADQDTLGQGVSIWPAGALQAGANGYVTLSCRIDVHGLAETCRVIYETPRGRGFGGAALALRPTFKVAPRQGPDGPEPATLNIAVAFRAKAMESNLQQVFGSASAVAPEGSLDRSQNVGGHEINGRNLAIYNNRIATRRMTMMTEPAWVRAPGFADWAAAYPPAGGGAEGYVVVHCRVQSTGLLRNCAAVKETPVGRGFGKAALALVDRFQASPQAMAQAPHGAPVEVDVPIRFVPPGEAADRTVRAPVFLVGADPETLSTMLPTAAGGKGAVVACTAGSDGALGDCRVELTSPEGIDFDEAALRMASRLKINLWSAEASPVIGGTLHIPVRPPAD